MRRFQHIAAAFVCAGEITVLICDHKPKRRGCKKGASRTLTPEQEKQVQKDICDKRPEQLKMDFALWTREAVIVYIRDRFGIDLKLELYTDEELAMIIERSASLLGIPTERDGVMEIASRSRGTPRIANRLLRRVRDFAEVAGDGVITKKLADLALTRLEIDASGLDAIDRRLLEGIIVNYGGGPVGLETIAATINEEPVTIEDVYEPFLMQKGFLARTPRGRCVTAKAYAHLGLPAPGRADPDQLGFL